MASKRAGKGTELRRSYTTGDLGKATENRGSMRRSTKTDDVSTVSTIPSSLRSSHIKSRSSESDMLELRRIPTFEDFRVPKVPQVWRAQTMSDIKVRTKKGPHNPDLEEKPSKFNQDAVWVTTSNWKASPPLIPGLYDPAIEENYKPTVAGYPKERDYPTPELLQRGIQWDIIKHSTYEDYVISKLTPRDIFYTQNQSIAALIYEMNALCNSSSRLSREEYDKMRKLYLLGPDAPGILVSCPKKVDVPLKFGDSPAMEDPLIRLLALREERNRAGRLRTIVFMRQSTSNRDISGYIDFADRMVHEDINDYFRGKKKLCPRRSDLSFLDTRGQSEPESNHSDNFVVLAWTDKGIMVRCLHDHATIDLGTAEPHPEEDFKVLGPNTTMVDVEMTPDRHYEQAFIIDHFIRGRVAYIPQRRKTLEQAAKD